MGTGTIISKIESLHKVSLNSTVFVTNTKFSHIFIFLKKKWFESFIGTDMELELISYFYISEVKLVSAKDNYFFKVIYDL